MNNFLVDQTITLILISQTIKYLISILIEIECINISPILILMKPVAPMVYMVKYLKNCSESLAYPLSLILKVPYNTGSLPKEWKLANVVPIHKKGGKDDIKNYRPISLTCLVMKLFERISKEELLLRTSHLLDNRQHGFLNLKSCSTNMISFTDNVVLSINDTRTLSTDLIYVVYHYSRAKRASAEVVYNVYQALT